MELPPHFSPKTILDLGTGPGTALWACLDSFSEISTLHGYDYHPELLALAQRVVDEFHIPNITLENGRLEHFPISSPSYDLVILSYVLNECSIETAWTVSEKAFDLTQGALLITLPGTPRDFHLLLNLRRKFIEKGVALWAPCPHLGPCPLEHGDWCHFSERLQRTPLHKTLKKGSLGYEDEKFCYLLLGHLPKEAYKRIIKPPQHKKGHVLLSVCTETGAEQQHTVSQKDPTYKLIKKKNWGDQIM
jgi:ribosomal protein RSM22 (predicted rRNA methylase)